MRKTRIYTEQPLAVGATVALAEQAKHHVAVVLRMQVHANIILFNNDGNDYIGTITLINKKRVEVTLNACEVNNNESGLTIHLGQCLSQGQRFDYAVQKATELGATAITPIISERSQKLAQKQFQKKQQHWQHIAVNAAEQSHRAQIPTIYTPVTLDDWLNTVKADVHWVCAISKTEQNVQAQKNVNTLALLIGPEGGLSNTEEQKAISQYNFTAVNFGSRVLRTETAPITAISLAQYFWGDFN